MKICFWGCIAGALRGNTCGGSELQSALLAKALSKGGHEVIILDYEITEDFVTTDGIKVFRIIGWNKGIRFIRVFTHRLPKLYKNLRNQEADIYYCRMRDFTHILAFWAARKAGSKFIMAMASDLDVSDFGMRLRHFYIPNLAYGGGLWWFFSGLLTELIHPWLLRKSDAVFVQHEWQKKMLLQKHIKSVLFPNLFDLNDIPAIENAVHNDFIYVGWLDKRKGFAEFFELVKKSPNHRFKVIGPPRDKTGYLYYEELKSFSNVSLLGVMEHSDTVYQIANSKALISTSPMEGFPNIFIEAWACGIPVLSLYFDPGGIIRREHLGVVGNGNPNVLLSAMTDINYNEEFAENAKAYVERRHAINTARIKQIRSLFEEVLNNANTNRD